MSDYVDTLRKKAREIAKKRATVMERLKADNEELTKLTAAEAGIGALLRLEGVTEVLPPLPPPPSVPPPAAAGNGSPKRGKSVLAKVLKDTLADGRIRDVGELIDAAKSRGVDFGKKDPWKAVNFTLMGIKTGRTIERVDGDRWRRAA
jgi:hypothetical protein